MNHVYPDGARSSNRMHVSGQFHCEFRFGWQVDRRLYRTCWIRVTAPTATMSPVAGLKAVKDSVSDAYTSTRRAVFEAGAWPGLLPGR